MKNFTKLRLFAVFIAIMCVAAAKADYTDISFSYDENGEWKSDGHVFCNKDGYYQEWDNYVVFWETSYGKQSDPQNVASIGTGDYSINLKELKQAAALCYSYYIYKLGMLPPKHKIVLLLFHSTDWFADASYYGSRDNIHAFMRLAHSSVNGNYYTFSHEIGHAFQYCCQAAGTGAGFRSTYYYTSYLEASANWQAAQLYPAQFFPTCYNLYAKTSNYALTHEWHGYQFYPINDYFIALRGDDAFGKIWTLVPSDTQADLLERYSAIYDVNAEELYKELFWYAMRTATWDLDRYGDYLDAQGVEVGKYISHTPSASKSSTTSQYIPLNLDSAIYQVTYCNCPQSTGFNCVSLNVPKSSTDRKITTSFTALVPGCELNEYDKKGYWDGDSWEVLTDEKYTTYNTQLSSGGNESFDTYKHWRGFRLGYITYNKTTGERKYNYADEVFCKDTAEVTVNFQFDVPSDVDSLYLVISPALENYIRRGGRNPYDISTVTAKERNVSGGDQWPYRIQFYGTNFYGKTNPTTEFEGEAVVGKTYTSYSLPDLAGIAPKYNYTIAMNEEAPETASFNTAPYVYSTDETTTYLSLKDIAEDNVKTTIFPYEIDGYTSNVSIADHDIKVNFVKVSDDSFTEIKDVTLVSSQTYSLLYRGSGYLKNTLNYFGTTDAVISDPTNWQAFSELTDGRPAQGKFVYYAIDAATSKLMATTAGESVFTALFDKQGNAVDADGAYSIAYRLDSANKRIYFDFTVLDKTLEQGTTANLQVAVGNVDEIGKFNLMKYIFHITIGKSASTSYGCMVQMLPGAPEGAGYTVDGTLNSTYNTYTKMNISSSNVAKYVTANEVEGYEAVVTVKGSVVTISYALPYSDEDVNQDGTVDSQDVLKIYDYMKTSTETPTSSTREDVNHDSTVDSQDVLKIYDYMKTH